MAENKDGKAYALCYNTGDEPVAPLVELEHCEIMREKDDISDEDINNGFETNELERVKVLRVFTDKDNDLTARILQELDPETVKGLNEEEMEHIKELINERPHHFGLLGEKLGATDLVAHKLITTTDTPIRGKRHCHPPAIKEEMQRQINEYLDEGIIRPSDSPYSSMMWVVPRKSGKMARKDGAW